MNFDSSRPSNMKLFIVAAVVVPLAPVVAYGDAGAGVVVLLLVVMMEALAKEETTAAAAEEALTLFEFVLLNIVAAEATKDAAVLSMLWLEMAAVTSVTIVATTGAICVGAIVVVVVGIDVFVIVNADSSSDVRGVVVVVIIVGSGAGGSVIVCTGNATVRFARNDGTADDVDDAFDAAKGALVPVMFSRTGGGCCIPVKSGDELIVPMTTPMRMMMMLMRIGMMMMGMMLLVAVCLEIGFESVENFKLYIYIGIIE